MVLMFLLLQAMLQTESINNDSTTGKKIIRKFSLFDYPLCSKAINIFKVSASTCDCTFQKSDILHKCFMIPNDNGYAIIPLLE